MNTNSFSLFLALVNLTVLNIRCAVVPGYIITFQIPGHLNGGFLQPTWRGGDGGGDEISRYLLGNFKFFGLFIKCVSHFNMRNNFLLEMNQFLEG